MYNSKAYFFLKNLQGDIIAVTDKDGETVAEYAYDAWGDCTVIDDRSGVGIANINPFRYRGYYLDIETGLYYLQSRYYNPAVGRFINSDDISFIRSTYMSNLFTYCNNNSVIYSDPLGYVALNLGVWNMTFRLGIYDFMYRYIDEFYYQANVLPTIGDSFRYGLFKSGSYFAKDALPYGRKFYEYFLSAKGGEYYYDYYIAFCQDSGIKSQVMFYIHQLYVYLMRSYRREKYCNKFSIKSFFITSNMCDVDCSTYDWKFALNRHKIGISAFVKKNGKVYDINFSIIAMDRYQFDKGDSFYGIPDDWNGNFVTFGWAKFFTSIGTMTGNMHINDEKIDNLSFS